METEKKVYSSNEKLLLINLVDKFKHIVENKKTDASNIRTKQETWNKIANLYNASSTSKRSSKQLKKLWDNLKQKTRKSDSQVKNQMLQTGGGPPPQEDNDPIHDHIRKIVPSINIEIKNPYDSIAVFEKQEQCMSSADTEFHNINKDEESTNNLELVAENTTLLIPSWSSILQESSVHEDLDANPMIANREDKENNPYMNGKKHKKMGKLNISKRSFAEEEIALRILKLKESIRQQKELHNLKIDVMKEELEAAKRQNEFWEKKILMLNKP